MELRTLPSRLVPCPHCLLCLACCPPAYSTAAEILLQAPSHGSINPEHFFGPAEITSAAPQPGE